MENQYALVTGSARRLGKKIALSLANGGYNIVIHYLHSRNEAKQTQEEIKKIGKDAIIVKADLTKINDIKRMFLSVYDKVGNIDVLVNNAAIFPNKTEFFKIKSDFWDKVINTNLKSVFFCCQEAAGNMLKRKSGKIINIASLGAFSHWTGYMPYCISKSGIITLTKILAKELAPYITVNAIAPGTIIVPNEEKKSQHLPKVTNILLRKYGKPSDVSELVLFIVKSSDYITGQVIQVDGGATIV